MANLNIEPAAPFSSIANQFDSLHTRLDALSDQISAVSLELTQQTQRVNALNTIVDVEQSAITALYDQVRENTRNMGQYEILYTALGDAHENLRREIQQKLREMQLGLDKQTARLDAHGRNFEQKFLELDARSQLLETTRVETNQRMADIENRLNQIQQALAQVQQASRDAIAGAVQSGFRW